MSLSDRKQAHLRAAAITGSDPADLPEHPQSAWGDEEEDYTQDEHDYSCGKASNRDSDGVGYPTAEETERFYDSHRREDIRIRKDGK